MLSEVTNTCVVNKQTSESKGQPAWDALVQQYADQPLIVVAELLHEVVRVSRMQNLCIWAAGTLTVIKRECNLLPGADTESRWAQTPCHNPKLMSLYAAKLDRLWLAMRSEL